MLKFQSYQIPYQQMKYIVETIDRSGRSRVAPMEQQKHEPVNVFYNIINPSNKIQCDLCKKDVSKSTKVLAQDCDYCVGCFSMLDSFPDHYHVINKLDFPLFDSEWTADEELMLFEGLEKHGFGNWGQISDLMNGSKSRQEIEDHYQTIFIELASDFLPTVPVLSKREANGKLTIKTTREGNERKKSGRLPSRNAQTTNTQLQRGALTLNHPANPKTGANPAEIVGYMPRRGDFQVEYDNDAELLLAEMEFNQDDSEEDKKMKFRLIEIYNEKLNQRIRRKDFVISRRLLDLKEQTRLDKTRTKEEKEIHSMMKVFARFNTFEAHEQLVSGIIREKQIRQQIEELKEFKKKGLRTLAEVQDELQNKRRKEEKPKKNAEFPNGEKDKTRRARKEMMIEKNEKRVPTLSREQEELCTRLNMTYRQYMLIKETIIRESVRQGILSRDETAKMFKIQRVAFEGIFDFLIEKEDIIVHSRDK